MTEQRPTGGRPSGRPVARWVRSQTRDLAIRAGIIPYKPLVWSPERWDESYRSGRTRDWEGVAELARYSILVGYVNFIGGQPRLLDVGCGAGSLRARLAGSAFGAYVGIDPVPAAIELADRLADERTRFVVGDPLDQDLGTFDIAVCNEVLYMAPDHVALLDRLVSLLRPGGHLLSSVWRHPGDTKVWHAVERRFERVDMVQVRNPANRMAPRGWRVAWHRRAG